MSNKEIADLFTLLSKVMEVHAENAFKIRAYRNAAFQIQQLEQSLAEIDLDKTKIPGIGDAIKKKIEDIIATGHLPLLDKYLAQTPDGIIDLLAVKGLGAKKITLLWKELGIESLGELEYACEENRLTTLKGFGAKTQAALLADIRFLRKNKGFYLYADIEDLALQLEQAIIKDFPKGTFSFTGDFRRQMPTLSQLDVLTTISANSLKKWLTTQDFKDPVVNGRWLVVQKKEQPKISWQCVAREDFARVLFETTNAPDFQTAFLKKYQIPEAPKSESDIFTFNHLAFVVPAMREDAAVLDLAAKDQLPKLIQQADIRGLIHCHSNYSDGLFPLKEMALAAKERGLEYMVITDHSQAAFYANGLKPDRIIKQHEEIDQLNQSLAPFKIFKGIESDILSDGSLDYEEEVLKTFDLVIASVHSNLKMDETKAMTRLMKAIENSYTKIIGHLTGRLLLSRRGFPIDHKKIIQACVANNVVIEINAHPKRLDLDWKWIRYALDQGALLSIDPDAHSKEGIDLIKYGILAAQKGGLTADRNLSSKNLIEFEQYLS